MHPTVFINDTHPDGDYRSFSVLRAYDTQTGERTYEVRLQGAAVGSPLLSPDGRHVAVLSESNGRYVHTLNFIGLQGAPSAQYSVQGNDPYPPSLTSDGQVAVHRRYGDDGSFFLPFPRR